MAKVKAPHHMHALTKASATHLLNHGHIDKKTHGKIVAHAERGMARAKAQAAVPQYEGSPADEQEDSMGAQAMGVSRGTYEKTSKDKKEDAAGQRQMQKAKPPLPRF